MASEMQDVISLTVGEPDFQTPLPIRQEAIQSLMDGKTKYSANAGLLELRQEISDYIKRKHGVYYNPKTQIVVTVGASEGVFSALRAIINQGDEVLVVEPSYVSYKPSVLMCGAIPVIIEAKAENNFRLKPDDILEKITDKTKAILINYPTNPTGAIMEKEDLQKIADVLADKEIIVISDEVYGELTYGDRRHTSIAECEEMYDKTILINGFSKAYSMTGWRLGYVCGPEDILQGVLKVHQNLSMCAPTTSQYAGIEALKNGDPQIEVMKKDYDYRRKFLLEGFRNLGMDCFEPFGAFYLFPSIKKTGLSSDEFCKRLLHEAKVAVVPGTAFGECGEGFIRCSYAYSIDSLKIALERIEKFLK